MLIRAALLGCALAGPAAGACRLALAVGIDVSSSVDAGEDALQRQGLAAALASEPVVAAALSVPGDHVALAVFEWSGRWQQAEILGWTALTDRAAIETAAARIAGSERVHTQFPTAAGYALGHALGLVRDGPDCFMAKVDLSGDGVNNDGFGPAAVYRHYDVAGITVNGLPITGHDPDVVAFYRDEVRYGPGAFVEVAEGFADFERAMRRKLEREMGARMVGSRE